jgi:hypothetical protein
VRPGVQNGQKSTLEFLITHGADQVRIVPSGLVRLGEKLQVQLDFAGGTPEPPNETLVLDESISVGLAVFDGELE